MKKAVKDNLQSYPKAIWWVLLACSIIAFLLFIPMNSIIKKFREDEVQKVELWARAISNKSELVNHTQEFYTRVTQDEQDKLKQYIEAYKIIMSQGLDVDLSSPSLSFYTKIIMDNKSIPVIITDEFNNITFSQNVQLDKNETVLSGERLRLFSQHQPLEYEVYGMRFKLYYTQSEVYTNMKKVLYDLGNTLLDEITENTIMVPVILTDSNHTKIYACGNIPLDKLTKDKQKQTIERMTAESTPIIITLLNGQKGYVYYKPSSTLTLLKYYPLLYFFVLMIGVVMFFMVLRTIRVGEQNKLWVGLGKETAHQLGTPISSLMAWIELLRTNPENEAACKEMDKDVKKLNMVSERFSQMGSKPTLKEQDITILLYNIVSYMQTRIPKKVTLKVDIPLTTPIILPLNKPLFEWTIENLIKNAVDAMEGNGSITISLKDMGTHVHLDVSDTGKGIFTSQYNKIFRPGFTTKKRGWGMGLSLVKRIIEEYHDGKIYVKNSIINVGTTFRIELNKKELEQNSVNNK